ncbi:hypothetical protein ABH940_003231 [Streptacidiphilus sp. BW17]|uniref:DUF742 domain-containing protein n=1 Tax=unclassified Streptacidiphilus TaxID=2643834 RepID=UPI003513B3E5
MPASRRTRLFALVPVPSAAGPPLAMHSFVTAAPNAQPRGLPAEWRAALAMCEAPRAVAEIAARLGLPLVTVIAMLTELADRGLLHHQPPMTEHQAADVTFLRRVRSGLQAL